MSITTSSEIAKLRVKASSAHVESIVAQALLISSLVSTIEDLESELKDYKNTESMLRREILSLEGQLDSIEEEA